MCIRDSQYLVLIVRVVLLIQVWRMYHVWYKTSTPSTLSKWSPLLHCLTTFGKRAGNHAVLGTVTHSSAAKKVQFIWSFGATHSQSCWHDKPLKLTRRIVYYEEKKQFVFVCSKSLASFKIDPNGCKNWNDTVDTIVLQCRACLLYTSPSPRD